MERRHLLDTNTVLFFFTNRNELTQNVLDELEDYNNLLYVSVISVRELIHLYNHGRIRTRWKQATDFLSDIKSSRFELLPLRWEHLVTYATLSTPKGHNDPNDHIIISQAITERMILISSDRKFEQYTAQRLQLIFNGR
ncbi:MAG: type II toxin-antitoxin system VapC family toxin [Prevotellaceae bacterium]|jgi:PIN domain nuclease of toxin-antitoxin system|nr:type II toxin-antitoxin system VapC family toxin [Prevotellaceae bacterium]